MDSKEKLDELEKELAELHKKIDGIGSIFGQKLQEIRSLIGPFGVPMPNNEMLVQTIYGVKYLIDPRDLVMAPNLIIYRQWEHDLSNFLPSHVGPNSVFVDVGANFGYFSCLLGTKIGNTGSGQIYSFEPAPHLYNLLRKNVQINWSMSPIHLHEAACSDGSLNEVSLYIPEDGAANSSMSVMDINSQVKEHKVKCVALDDAIPSNIDVDLIKIDVEGHELDVLKGAKNTISRSKNITIVIEWSIDQMNSAGHKPSDLYETFAQLGLKAYSLPNNFLPLNGSESPLNLIQLENTPYANIVLSK